MVLIAVSAVCEKLSWGCSSVGRVVTSYAWSLASIPRMMIYVCNPSTWEVEARGAEIQGHPQLHCELTGSLRLNGWSPWLYWWKGSDRYSRRDRTDSPSRQCAVQTACSLTLRHHFFLGFPFGFFRTWVTVSTESWGHGGCMEESCLQRLLFNKCWTSLSYQVFLSTMPLSGS